MTKENKNTVDIFKLLTSTAEKEKRKSREEYLVPLGVKEFFVNGNITINKRICEGVDCQLCTKACPTNALYWKKGEIGIEGKLCIYCGACVLSCIVDDCIKVKRKRLTGETERFSTPKDVVTLQNCINTKKRAERVLFKHK